MIDWPILPENIKYKLKYEKFILSLKDRVIPEGQYFENHHIVPRSMGGSNDKTNLIKLLPREHYIAHAMLWKMKFPGVYHAKMAYAFCTFIHGFKYKRHKNSYKFSSRLYDSFKRNLSKVQSEYQSGEGNPFYGKKHSLETKEKIRAYRKGKKLEEIFSPKAIANIRLARQNLVITEETKRKVKEGQKKYWSKKENKEKKSALSKKMWGDPNYKEKMRPYIEARKGVPRDPSVIEKCAAAKRGKKEHEIYSPQALENRRRARENIVVSEEQRKALSERAKIVFKGKKQTEEQIRKRVESTNKTKALKKAAGFKRKSSVFTEEQKRLKIEKQKATMNAKKAAGWVNPSKGRPRDPKIIEKMNAARLAKRNPK